MLATTAGLAGLVFAGNQVHASTVSVQSGDTVWGLSQSYGVSIDAIEQANGIDTISHLITVGQTLNIPDGTDAAASTQATVNYSAQPTQTVQPAAETQTAVATQPVQQAQTTSTYTSNASGSDAAAKAWIAGRESGGSYTASNGQYYGKYQLSSSYLNGDYSAANQERVADQYVTSRYGSWSNAMSFWQANGWY